MRVDPNYLANLSQAISQASSTEQKLTGELSSGLRVGTLSDDAVAVSANVSLSSSIARIDSFVQSATREQSLLQVTDSTLGTVVSQITSAIGLGVTASSGTLSGANLSAIARQVSDLRDGVVSLANTSYLGKYIFSGSLGSTQPFVLDTTTIPATTTYQGDALTQNIETQDGQKVQVNVAGSDLFTAPGANLLSALNKLANDITAGAISNVQADTAALTQALSHVSEQRSTIGSSLSRLSTTTGYAESQNALLKAQQSVLLSADTAKVATDLKTVEVQHQALLSVVGALNKYNLFDYLK